VEKFAKESIGTHLEKELRLALSLAIKIHLYLAAKRFFKSVHKIYAQ